MIERTGKRLTVRRILYRLCQRLCGLECFHVEQLDFRDLRIGRHAGLPVEFRFLTADEIRRFSTDPASDLPASMASRLDSGQDFCFAALAGQRLASHVWFALRWIEPEHCAAVGMSFPDGVAYAYKAFTHPDFRGQRLNGLTTGMAFQRLAQRGIGRLVCIIEWTNQASLQSYRRLGFVGVGSLWTAPCRNRRWFRAPKRAAALGLAFGGRPTPPQAPAGIRPQPSFSSPGVYAWEDGGRKNLSSGPLKGADRLQ